MDAKDKINSGDIVDHHIIRSDGSIEKEGPVDRVKPEGILEITQIRDGLVIKRERRHNTINSGILDYFADRMVATFPDYALNNLMTADNEQVGGSQDGFDGISVTDAEGAGTNLSTVTTSEIQSQTFGSKWKGVIDFDAAYTRIESCAIGFNYGQGGALYEVTYASQVIDYNVQTSDRLVLNWEIYL